jgi:hypothetical protein
MHRQEQPLMAGYLDNQWIIPEVLDRIFHDGLLDGLLRPSNADQNKIWSKAFERVRNFPRSWNGEKHRLSYRQ